MQEESVSDASPAVASASPSLCPFCRSNDISTTSKKPDTASYWRCTACGEIWNVDRLQQANRYGSGRGGWRGR
jgi:transposase-like protein